MTKPNRTCNKYFIAQYCKEEIKVCKNEEEYEALLKKIKKNNNSKNSDLLLGNIHKSYNSNGEILASISVYYKLTDRRTIKDIDKETMQMQNMKEFYDIYGPKIMNNAKNPEIIHLAPSNYKKNCSIKGKFDIGICYEDLFFEEDKKYMDEKVLYTTFEHLEEQNNIEFFARVAAHFKGYPAIEEIRTKLLEKALNAPNNQYYYGNYAYHLSVLYRMLTTKYANGRPVTDENGFKEENYKAKRNFAIYMKKNFASAVEYKYDQLENEVQKKLKK